MAASCDGHAVNAAGDSSYVFVKNSQAVREDSADGDEQQACHQLAVGSVAPVCTEAESACDKPFCNDEAAFREAECPADREEKLAVAAGSTCDAAAAGNENAPQLAVGSDAPFCNEAESACDKTFCKAAFCGAKCSADGEKNSSAGRRSRFSL